VIVPAQFRVQFAEKRKRSKDENEGDVLRALNMADGMEGKLDKIIAQLRKLQSIETTLSKVSNKVAKIEGEVKKLQSDASLMDGQVKEPVSPKVLCAVVFLF